MAFTAYGKDLLWVFPGDIVTLTATYTVGNRFRCRLVSKPSSSALELWDEAKQNWLESNQIVPDVGGRYSFTFVEETSSYDIPHFSNDLGVNGVETVTTIATQTYAFTVCSKLTRDIGVAPDKCVLELWACSDDDTSSPTHGVLTYLADATKCPVLTTDGSSDSAKNAAFATTTAATVQLVGGYGDAFHIYGDPTYNQFSTMISWDDLISSDPIGDLGRTIWSLNEHISTATLDVHGAADAGNAITAADATVGGAASQVTLLNDIRTQLIAHVVLTAGSVHSNADTVAQAELALLAALPGGATLAQRIARTNELLDVVAGHLPRGTINLNTYTPVHLFPGDNRPVLISCWTEANAVTLMNALKTHYEAHRVKTNLVAGGYHNIVGTTDNTYNEQVPLDRDGYVKAVSGALDIFHAHVTNRNPADGTINLYHTSADWAHRADLLGKPTDFASAVVYHELLDWLLTKHVSTAGSVHSTLAYPGRWYRIFSGIPAIHASFRDNLTSSTGSVPVNENQAAGKLVLLGGFSKV